MMLTRPEVTYAEDDALAAAAAGVDVAILCRSPKQARLILDDLACAADGIRVWTDPRYRRIDVPGGGILRVYDPTQTPSDRCTLTLTA